MSTVETSQPALGYRGLTNEQVEASRQQHGANVLTPPKREPWWKLYLEKYDDPVIRILIIAAVIAIGVGLVDGKYAEGVGIVIAILLATTLAFLNEYRAAQEFDILNRTNDDVPVKTLRNGTFLTVPRRDLVVGDIAQIEVGEEVPADGQVLEAVSFQVNEARLTGEFKPVDKVSKDAAERLAGRESAYPADRVLRGTIVLDGYAIMALTAVGDATEIGKTARAAAEEADQETPLNRQLAQLSKLIGVVGFAVAVLTFAALVTRGLVLGELGLTPQQWYFVAVLGIGVVVALVRVWLPILYDGLEMLRVGAEPPKWQENESILAWVTAVGLGACLFLLGIAAGWLLGWMPAEEWLPMEVGHRFLIYFMIAVTIIVVAVPEGLAMSVTLSLAYSMRKMTATNNLVRRMHACETIGAATVICSDKTGTLTLNEMRVFNARFLDSLHSPSIGVAGHPDHGLPSPNSTPCHPLVIESICANTTAQLSRAPGEPAKPLGNPTEGALLLWLDEQGIDYTVHRARFGILYQWTFTTDRKYMATLGRSAVTGHEVLHVKGAPEIVLEHCSQVAVASENSGLSTRALTPEMRTAIEEELKSYQARGMRTLGFAYYEAPNHYDGVTIDEVAQEMTWLGFAAIADPVRPEVPDAIRACRKAGVDVKVVTGDNPETGLEIARQIGLWDEHDHADRHLLGRQFMELPDPSAQEAARRLKVLSRARPADKLRLVRLLQEQGEVVAVTGDGVNDGPALNYANVGLAMGKTGTAVAKEASDIILLDDSFRSIVNAILWGRSLYENIQRFILFQLTINVAALSIAFLGPFIGFELPLTVMQMLWINLIMDTFAALALATEPPHWNVMNRPPRDPKAFIVTPMMARNIFITAALFLVVLISLVVGLQRTGLLPPADTPSRGGTILFTVFVLLQFWNLFNARSLGRHSSAFTGLWENKSFLGIALAILLGQVLLVNFGGAVFRTVPLKWSDWLIIFFGTSVVLWLGELVRWRRRSAVAGPTSSS